MRRFGQPRAATRAQERRGWYRIANAVGAEDRPARIDLFDEIGFWGTPASAFLDELKSVTAPSVDLHINSPGGEIFDGYAIYNALANHPAHINVVVEGIAASAASFIAQAGDTVRMHESSQMMIHDGIAFVFGNAGDLREQATLLDKLSGQIANIYAARSGIEADSWRNLMLAETWFTADEAVTAGLADEVIPMKRRDSVSNRASAVDPLSMLWDLSPFRYDGRNALDAARRAPAPAVVAAARSDKPGSAPEREATDDDGVLTWLLDHPESSTVDTTDPLSALRG